MVHRGKVVNLQSAYISGISLTLLIKPQGGALWPFVLGGFLAISSKYVLRYRDNHLWNPTNFAIVALLLAAPDRVSVLSHQFGNDIATNLVIWIFGLVIAARVGVLHITLTYVASFLVLNSAARGGARPAGAAGDRADHRADVSAVHFLHDHRSAHGRARAAEADRRGDPHRDHGDADSVRVRSGLAAADGVQRCAGVPRARDWLVRSRSGSTCGAGAVHEGSGHPSKRRQTRPPL